MVGQVNLINKLKSYTIDSFPQTLLLTGEKGSGKHSLVREVISPHLKLDIIDITDNISFDYILEIQLRVIPSIYLIDVTLIKGD
jgi:predicted AAA+ superfamily ATPase